MMATTHALVGAALGVVVAAVAPGFASVAVLAGFCGGLVPDLDLLAGHRKTLHFPVYFSAVALGAFAASLAVPTAVTVGLAAFFLAAAVHSVMDVLGGGLEARPWLAQSDEGVYSHYHGTWIAPRRWIRYDGAPEDLALATAVAVPLFVVVDDPVKTLVVGSVVVSTVYTVVRKRLPDVEAALVETMPDHLLDRVPDGVLGADKQ